MREKDKAVEHLKKLGYNAYNEDGVVMVRSCDRGIVKKVKDELKKIGYDCSYGFVFGPEKEV